LEPLLPGKYSLEVYTPSSMKGYPIAATTAVVQAGKILQARLVVDLGGMGGIEGVVTQDGAPVSNAIIEAYADDRSWISGAETHTDANGAYRLANIRPGETTVTAWGPGEGNKMLHKTVQVTQNQVQTADFNFESHAGGIEGTVTINGKPGYAFIDVSSGEGPDKSSVSSMSSQQDGSYRVNNLAPGSYTVRVTNIYADSRTKMPRELVVQVNEGEIARCDVAFDSGAIECIVNGLREGEQAEIGLFVEPVDAATIANMSLADLEGALAANATLQPGQSFKWDDLEPGQYYFAVIAVSANADVSEADIAAAIRNRRFYFQPVEVLSNQTSTVQAVLP
jgi:hypothetical protein